MDAATLRSLTLVGVTLNLTNAIQELGSLPKTMGYFAGFKYVNLIAEVSEDNITLSNKGRLLAILTDSALFLARQPRVRRGHAL